ncbi:MAG: hypothetical protein IT327_03390 [Anaerolineae bacterium]|nr:hypothetical protein [Anaerolineae bacterium]
MTVITTVISKVCTAHATDSLITVKSNDGKREVLEREKSKVVCVRPWRGAMSCWGLGKIENQWTIDWLHRKTAKANQFSSPEEFAAYIKDQLNNSLSRMRFGRPLEAGIGIHFTAYEYVDGYYIPELFQLTNFKDPSVGSSSRYRELYQEGVIVRREAYENYANDNKNERDRPHRSEHRLPKHRHELREFLNAGGILLFNNGDTFMFNAAISGILSMFNISRERKVLDLPEEPATFRKIALWPIDQVCKVQENFVIEGYRLVGGKRHNISITPQGEYESDTGDNC